MVPQPIHYHLSCGWRELFLLHPEDAAPGSGCFESHPSDSKTGRHAAPAREGDEMKQNLNVIVYGSYQKSEIRISKLETNLKYQFRNSNVVLFRLLCILNIRVCFGFSASDFDILFMRWGDGSCHDLVVSRWVSHHSLCCFGRIQSGSGSPLSDQPGTKKNGTS